MPKENKAPREQVVFSRPFVTSDNANIETSDVAPLAETSGTLRIMAVGWNGSAEARFQTNSSNQLQVEIVGAETPINLDPVIIPSSEGVLLDGSASLTSGGIYEVTFEIVNVDGTDDVTVSVGVDVGAAGSLAGPEYLIRNFIVAAGGNTASGNLNQLKRTITIGADDDIRGVASAADDAAIHFISIKRVR